MARPRPPGDGGRGEEGGATMRRTEFIAWLNRVVREEQEMAGRLQVWAAWRLEASFTKAKKMGGRISLGDY